MAARWSISLGITCFLWGCGLQPLVASDTNTPLAPDDTPIGSANETGSIDEPTIRRPELGDLIISEIMVTPAALPDPNGEWLEIYNASTDFIEISGLTLRDDSGEQVNIPTKTHVTLDPLAYALFCHSKELLESSGHNCTWSWDSDTFTIKDTDQIVLVWAGNEMDRVDFDPTWSFTPGFAKGVKPALLDIYVNDSPDVWCNQTSATPVGDMGTPGRRNDPC